MSSVESCDLLESATGERLDLHTYRSDFRTRLHTGGDSWKLERQQSFQEPGFVSWEAMAHGDWAGSLRLMEQERQGLLDSSRDNLRRGVTFHRVRVVEEPLTPYLQWELHLLKLRAECGDKIRVIDPERVAGMEPNGPLPELVSVGGDTVYRILYDAQGVLDGAVRYTGAETVRRYEAYVQGLYAAGEEVDSYFTRKVAHLPPPRLEHRHERHQ